MIRAFLRDPKSQISSGLQDLQLGLDNLRVHKLRSLLTMLGMIFGVAAVVAMLSIGAYPIWSVIILGLDGLVIYVLTVYGTGRSTA